ncbi:TPA: hypothetical protein DIV49_01560 [Candidatus Saccharibacteria bacterium]|nr:hypothetical protein [Candidatus Saccharibacteria bacterium]
MSQKLVSLNEDLSRLWALGLELEIVKSGETAFLVVRNVPYVSPTKDVKRGAIISALDLAGEITQPPESHVAFFAGHCPCDENGSPLPGVSQNTNLAIGKELTPNHQMSRKPTAGSNPGKYSNYYDKIKTYVDIVCSPAQTIDPAVSARTYPVNIPDQEESLFNYFDTAATKAGIVVANKKLEVGKVAIVGTGATGSFVLDFVAKTHVAEVHLFDGDIFLNHNVFRCPGAASIEALNKKNLKVDHLAEIYSHLRRGIIPHGYFVDETTIEQLKLMSFVFICIDKGAVKQLIVEQLECWSIPFIDVGMGVQLGDNDTLGGIVTVTTSTPNHRDHFRTRTSFTDGEAENEYSRNVQIVELNALNASLAVIKWKKLCGYYDDVTNEQYCAYTIRSNQLISEDICEN